MKIVVVGGGTAGWLSALYVQKYIPYSQVTVIASSEIGILGAGEGTNWDFVEFLKKIDVPIEGIIKNARGTFKNGIKFTNWNGDGEHYYHPFQDHLGKPGDPTFNIRPLYLSKISKNETLSDLQFTSIASENNRVKFNKNNEPLGIISLHFDANLLAKYLQDVALSRGIKLIDDEVVDFVTKSNGDISSITLKSGKDCETEFVFDCTGFKRLIIGGHYKSEWESYLPSLPVNRAMPFFIDNTSTDIPPYTESIAMKYGWMWKIPVQGRFGCGYVFDSRLVSDEEIKQELTEYLGYEPTIPRVFNFEPGVYKKLWINNCLAIGLSSGFVEPLEATSIQVTTFALQLFVGRFNNLAVRGTSKQQHMDGFNDEMKRINYHILNFLHFHYLSKRNDSKFWTDFKQRTVAPGFVKKFSEIANKKFPNEGEYEYIGLSTAPSVKQIQNPFSLYSWQMVGAGIKYFNHNVANKDLQSYIERTFSSKTFDADNSEVMLKELLTDAANEAYDHYEYIEYLKNL
jgi:tryptophan halogenase